MRIGWIVAALASLLVVAWLSRASGSAPTPPELVGAAEDLARAPSMDLPDPVLARSEPAGSEVGRAAARVVAPTPDPIPRTTEPDLHPVAARVVCGTGEPVADARFVDPHREGEFRAHGDGEGNYELRLPAGSWTLAVTADTPRRVSGVREPIEVPYVGPPLVFVVHEPAHLEGRVVDAGGAPVAGVEVHASPPSTPASHGSRKTDESGRFRFEELPIGNVVLVARLGWLEAGSTEVLDEGENRAATLALPPGGRLVVFAHDEAGAPRDDVRTLVFRDSREIGGAAPPGVPYGPLPVGPVEVLGLFPPDDPTQSPEFTVTQRAEIVAGELTEVHLRPEPTQGVVEGTVRWAGKPYARKSLLAFLEGRALTEGVRLLRTDEFGHYRLELPHAAGVVFAVDFGGGVRAVSHLPFTESERVRHDIDIASARLSGRIEGFEAGEAWTVDLQPEPRAAELTVPRRNHGEGVNEDGTFAFELLRPGTYRVSARENDGDVAGPATVELPENGAVAEVTLVRQAAGVLSGHVRDAAGRPVAAAVVHVRSSDGRPHVELARTDAVGRFEVPWLLPGEVVVCAQSETQVGTLRLRMAPDRTEPIELALVPGARIRARVVGPEGVPGIACLRAFDVVGAEVTAWRGPSGSSDSFSAVVSTSERVFGPLPAGRYELVAETLAGRVIRRAVDLGSSDVEVELEL